ncbi:MAG: hypothetical protein HXX10_08945 [Rhodoplanes sp.]|uniref:hypothetical protein n=1 Tax=Rhodoplanes sp. TaxID=1968906 RepID=UPI0017F6A83E|nr:hypothetical protein [Rhodoplanes sp.]NVO14148.1 hypothetical protein [Rhodoplanes sp.]
MISLAFNAALAFYGAFLLAALSPSPPDPFSRAVTFALTGSDRGIVRPVDWTACVFEVDGAQFRVGAVDTDRLSIELRDVPSDWGQVQRVAVGLHGEAPVYERIERAIEDSNPMDDDFALMLKAELKQRSPGLFEDRRTAETDYTLLLGTTDVARVRHDWGVLIRACSGPPHGP